MNVALSEFISKMKNDVEDVDSASPVPDVPEPAADVLPPDPPPARRESAGVRKNPKPAAGAKPTAAVRRQVADSLSLMIGIPAGIWAIRDPVCGGALLEHLDNIVARFLPIVCRNPAALRFFVEGDGYMEWVAAVSSLVPVCQAIWAHHVTREIGQEAPDAVPDDFARYSA